MIKTKEWRNKLSDSASSSNDVAVDAVKREGSVKLEIEALGPESPFLFVELGRTELVMVL